MRTFITVGGFDGLRVALTAVMVLVWATAHVAAFALGKSIGRREQQEDELFHLRAQRVK